MSITVTNQQNLLSQASGTTTTTSSSAASDATKLGQADFLELLTVQLQNQDPMSPMSDMDFIASMSSFSSVEAMASLSTNFENFMNDQEELNSATLDALTTLAKNMGSSNTLQNQLTAQSYLGKEVTIYDSEKGEFTGIVDRIEFISKEYEDGTSEQIVGLVVNDEIFPISQVTGVAESGGFVSTLSNAVSSAIQVASNIL